MHRTLIVANRTASTPVLLQEVEHRNAREFTSFTLLVPNIASRKGSDWTLEDALQALRKAARGPHGLQDANVDGLPGGDDPFEAIKQALEQGDFDDVIISTLPQRSSEWLKGALPRRVEELGIPVTVITPPSSGGFSLFARGPGQQERPT
jgi:hypothetical protein